MPETYSDPGASQIGRRSFLHGLGGAIVLAGTGGMAGCSAIGSGYSTANEIVVEDAAEHDDLGRQVDGDTYFVRPSNWEGSVGTLRGGGVSLAYPEKTKVEEGDYDYNAVGPGGEGLIPVADDRPNLWTPGLHEETQQIPIVFDDRWITYEKPNDVEADLVKIRTILDEPNYPLEVHYNGPLKESWFQDYAEDDRLNIGAIDASPWINDDIVQFLIQFTSTSEIGNRRPYFWFGKEL